MLEALITLFVVNNAHEGHRLLIVSNVIGDPFTLRLVTIASHEIVGPSGRRYP